ncbi:MAG: hypothetical protein KF789_00660 [Bdellovibrionaceae bacterium]|nr:hypothetical protein [Pseudobdellovibrionaceae bacterium]
MTNMHIDLIIGANTAAPSFAPLNSDSLINALHVEQAVGTLVRLGPGGRYEPYLANQWSNSNDHKKWTFEIRQGLYCEDGTHINAPNFIASLKTLIKMFSEHAPIPLIEKLTGYKPFVDGITKELPGLRAISPDTIELAFDTPVQAGLLEYLGLPFLGFYCPGNFDSSGKWKDSKKIISSASYSIDAWDGITPITLNKRRNWPLADEQSPSSVTIHRSTTVPTEATGRKVILQFKQDEFPESKDFQSVHLIPTSLFAIVLSPSKGSPFHIKQNRKAFQLKVRSLDFSSTSPQGQRTNRFYPHLSKDRESLPSPELETLSQAAEIKKVRIYGKHSSEKTPSSSLRYLIESSLDSLGTTYDYTQKTPAEQDMMNFRNFEHWDIRPTNVDIGGGIENQLIKFMFCSKLGVAFPDPSGRICALVNEYEEQFGDVVPKEAMEEYLNRFDQIIEEDAAVIPVLKSGKTWLVSPDLDASFLSPTTAVPFFDLIRLK